MDTINFYGNLFENTYNLNVGNGVTKAEFINNTFANTNSFAGQKIVVSDAPAIEKNNVYAIQTGDITTQFNGGATSTTNYTIQGSSSTWSNDPGFVSTTDFNLLIGSPLIDNGTNDSKITEDLNGILRPQNGIMDIGAYEYTAGVSESSGGKKMLSGNGYSLQLKGKTLKK